MNMSTPPSNLNGKSLVETLINEMERQGYPPKTLEKAKKLLLDNESKEEIIARTKIDKKKMKKATGIKNRIDTLTNEILMLRYRVNEDSKIMGKRIFEDNSETGRISHELKERSVVNPDTLHLFIDDIHKYIVQSARWDELSKIPEIEPTLRIIGLYRNSFNHIIDMKGGGTGSERAYEDLGKINKELLGHKVIRIEEYPLLQIAILERVKKLLTALENNIEDWLK